MAAGATKATARTGESAAQSIATPNVQRGNRQRAQPLRPRVAVTRPPATAPMPIADARNP